ncbi:unnamed protein product, partial [Brassica oleracea var. botrytis]
MVHLMILDSASALFRDLHSMTAMEYKLYSLQPSTPGYAKVPFLSYEDRLQSSRFLFSDAVPFIGGYFRRHHTEEAAVGYRSLCLRGFVVQGSLDHKNPVLEDVYRIIDSIGWSYTVMHVHPFCP